MELQEEVIEHPIIWAARNDHVEIVRKFLDLDKSLSKKKDRAGRNLLHLIRNQRLFKELVLLDRTLLMEKDSDGNYPIYWMPSSWGDQFVKWVIEQDRSQLYLENEDGNLLIHICLGYNTAPNSIVEWMLSEDFSLARARNKYGQTPLHLAFRSSHFSLAELLIKKDPELIFERDIDGRLPIAYARYEEQSTDFFLRLFEQSPELALEKGMDPTCYPIHYAASDGNLTLVEYLFEKTPQDLLESR